MKVKVFSEEKGLARKVVSKIREIYRVDFDYGRFLSNVRDTPLYAIAKKYYGLRSTRMVSVYEALVDSIIERTLT